MHEQLAELIECLIETLPPGCVLGYAIPDVDAGDGGLAFDAEVKRHWQDRLQRYGATDDLAALPGPAGDVADLDVVIELLHPATSTRVVRTVRLRWLADFLELPALERRERLQTELAWLPARAILRTPALVVADSGHSELEAAG